MFENGFPKHWSTLKKLIWLVGSGVAGGASAAIKTVSGAIVHITDALAKPAISLVCQINPLQDLHGQANPYPAGGGKNKCAVNTVENIGWATENADLLTSINALPNGTYTMSFKSTIKSLDSPEYVSADWISGFIFTNSAGNFACQVVTSTSHPVGTTVTYAKNLEITDSNRGAFTHAYVYGAGNNSVGKIGTATLSEIQIEPGEVQTSFAPYSNECPISGHTECDIWDDPAYGGNINWNQIFKGSSGGGNGLTLTVDTSTEKLTISGTASANTYVKQGNIPKSIIGHKYFASIDTSNDNIQFYNDTGGVLVKGSIPSTIGTATGEKDWYCRFANGAVFGTGVSFTPQLIDLTQMFGEGNEPSTVEEFKALFPKAYYPYNAGEETLVSAVNGDPYWNVPVSWQTEAGTVYGGSDELISGVLTSSKFLIDDFTNLTVTLNKEVGIIRSFYLTIPSSIERNADKYVLSNLFTSQPLTEDHAYDCEVDFVNYSVKQRIYFSISNIDHPGMTGAQAKQFLIDNNVQFLINLATPITYQLDPVTVNLLLGENNLWHDANGNTELTYYADGNASTQEALGILLGGAYHNPGGDDDATDEEALGILLGN